MEIILKCCEQPFAVQKMELFRGTWVLGANLDERVRFCPFCGRNLTPRAADLPIGSSCPHGYAKKFDCPDCVPSRTSATR